MMVRLKLLLLLLTGLFATALAEVELDTIRDVRSSYQKNTLRLVVETGRKPEASVFFSTGPEALVVEFNDAVPGTQKMPRVRHSMIRSLGLKRISLNRSRLVLGLNYRPGDSGFTVETLENPCRLVVELPLDGPERKEKLALTSGVDWIREDRLMAGRWVRLNRLQFDPADPAIEIILGLAREKTNARETVSSMVKRHGALAGINGGFFASGGGALGLVYRDGRLLVPHVARRPPRSGFGLSSRGKPMIGRLASTGRSVKDLDRNQEWSDAHLALGGGPRLIQDGKARITAKQEELGPGGNDITRVAARTVVGITKGDKLVFATVAGFRDNHSQGAKFEPVVSWLKSLGVEEAVNFDGGASVDMVVGDHIVSDGPANTSKEKPVATALLVKDSRERLYPSRVRWEVGSTRLPADGKATQKVKATLTSPAGRPVPDGTKVRLFAHNLEVTPARAKTENGQVEFTVKSVLRPGKGRLTLEAGPLKEVRSFQLEEGKPVRLQLLEGSREPITVEKEKMQLVKMKVQLTDGWGNPCRNAPLGVIIDGSEPFPFRTDGEGMMVLDVQAYPDGGLLKVTNPDAGSASYRIPALK